MYFQSGFASGVLYGSSPSFICEILNLVCEHSLRKFVAISHRLDYFIFDIESQGHVVRCY